MISINSESRSLEASMFAAAGNVVKPGVTRLIPVLNELLKYLSASDLLRLRMVAHSFDARVVHFIQNPYHFTTPSVAAILRIIRARIPAYLEGLHLSYKIGSSISNWLEYQSTNFSNPTVRSLFLAIRSDRTLMLDAFRAGGGWCLQYADDVLKTDRELVLAAVTSCSSALEAADASLRRDREIVLIAVKQNGLALQFAHGSLQADLDIVLTAIACHPCALRYAHPLLRANKAIVLAAVTRQRDAFQYADDALKADKEFVLAAVKQNGLALQFAHASLKADKEVALAAVTQCGMAFEYVDHALKADREVALAAVTNHYLSFEHIDPSLQKDPEIVLTAQHGRGAAAIARQYRNDYCAYFRACFLRRE